VRAAASRGAALARLSRGARFARLTGGTGLLILGALRRTAGSLAGASPPAHDRRLAWRELANKLEAFEAFRRAELEARLRAADPPLASLVERALSLGPFRTVWTIEGHGYGHAERRAARGAAPRDWLAADTAGLPPASLIALHCGIGLSLARRRLAASAAAPAAELRRAVAAHLADCRELAPPGQAQPLLEALGFIARLRLPRRVAEMAGELARLDDEAHACFWHGLGRALYFVPGHAVPWASAPWRAVAALAREAPPGAARDNALAGLAWAVTLVNLRHPQVLEQLLRHHAAQVAGEPCFAHGVTSGLLVWQDCAPDDPCLESWRRHQPPPAGGELALLWGSQVSGPAEAVLARAPHREGPGSGKGLSELFRYRPERSPCRTGE
jgi:hypothetical protein